MGRDDLREIGHRLYYNIKVDLIDEFMKMWTYLCGSVYGTMVGSFECVKESLGYMKGRKFRDKLSGS